MRTKKWLVAAGAILVSGALVTGVAVAATAPAGKVAHRHHEEMMGKKPDLQELVKEGKITQGQADVMAQLQGLHQKAMEQFKADAKAVIDQAAKDGKITPEQAERMKARGAMMHHHHGTPGKRHLPPGKHGKPLGPKSEADLKALLAEKVKAGRLTQEKADQILKKWQSQQSAKPSSQG